MAWPAITSLPFDRGITTFAPSTLAGVTADRIEKGITFLQSEVGNTYGWCNIANNVLALLHLPYRISRLDHYDCSSLVTCYLAVVRVWLGDDSEEPDSVSPNDLARALRVIR